MRFFTTIIYAILGCIVCASPVPEPGPWCHTCYGDWWTTKVTKVQSYESTVTGSSSVVPTSTSLAAGPTSSVGAVSTPTNYVSTPSPSPYGSSSSPAPGATGGSGSMANNPPSGNEGENNILFVNQNQASGYYIMWDPPPSFGQGQYIEASGSWRSPSFEASYSPNVKAWPEDTYTGALGAAAVWAEVTFIGFDGKNFLDVSALKCPIGQSDVDCQNGIHWMVAESDPSVLSGCDTFSSSCQGGQSGAYVDQAQGNNTQAGFTGSLKTILCSGTCAAP